MVIALFVSISSIMVREVELGVVAYVNKNTKQKIIV